MTITKEKYPAWIYRNFKNFLRAFHYDDGLNCFLSASYLQKSIVSCHEKLVLGRYDNTITITDLKTGRIGMAKCHDADAFDIVTGIAIAWARYCAKNEQQLAETNKTISQLDCDKLGNVPVHSYVRRDTKQVFFVIGANPIRTGYIICINCRSGQPVNLPKDIIVHII